MTTERDQLRAAIEQAQQEAHLAARAEAKATAARSRADAAQQQAWTEAQARRRSWAESVIAEGPAASRAAADRVAEAWRAFRLSVLDGGSSAIAFYLAWRAARASANRLHERRGNALAALGRDADTSLAPHRDTLTFSDALDSVIGERSAEIEGDAREELSAEITSVVEGQWTDPALVVQHKAGCPGGPVETHTTTRPGRVVETLGKPMGERPAPTEVTREPAVALTVVRCTQCGAQRERAA